LVVDPVLIPNLLTVLPLQIRECLAPEEIDEEPDGRVSEVFRGRRGWWRGIEGQGVQAFGRDVVTLGPKLADEELSPQYTPEFASTASVEFGMIPAPRP
jgi:hypothetical protein